MPRQRFKVKPGLLGSSDFRRVKSSRAILEENHKRNTAFFLSIKPEVEECKETIITEKYILSRYSRVLVMEQWCPLSKFIGSLEFMYNNDKYLFE